MSAGETVTVDANALRTVLAAFMGPAHHVMEQWAIRSLPSSDVKKLIDQFNEQAEAPPPEAPKGD